MPDVHAIPDPLLKKARRWEEAWGLPGLLDSVTVEFTTKMRVSPGLCRPIQGRIRLAAGRPVRQWRCARCRDAGQSGTLIITRLAPASAEP